MPLEQPHQDSNDRQIPTEHPEKGPEVTDPATMAQERIANAERLASIDQHQLNDIRRMEKVATPEAANKISEKQILDRIRSNTLSVIDKRIARMRATLANDQQNYDSPKFGKRLDSVFKFGGLLGTTTLGAEAKGIADQKIAITKIQELRSTVAAAQTIDALKSARTRLGVAELPQDLVADYDTYQAMASSGAAGKDKSMEVDWQAINEQLKTAEAVLDRWEMVLQTIDTGMGIAAGMIPGGSEVYELSRACTSVAIGTMTADQAAREFIFGVIASKVGGKAMSKLNIDEFAEEWIKKNATFFSDKTAKALARITGKTTAGGTQGAISGGAEGTMHGGYNVSTGKNTLEEAVADTQNRMLIGATFGGTLRGAGEGLSIRSEVISAKKTQELHDNIMRLPETSEGRQLRTMAAEDILERSLTPEQHRAILEAHDVQMKGDKYSVAELAQKMRILEASGMSRSDADQLLRMGVCGAPPPSPQSNRPKPLPDHPHASAKPKPMQVPPPAPSRKSVPPPNVSAKPKPAPPSPSPASVPAVAPPSGPVVPKAPPPMPPKVVRPVVEQPSIGAKPKQPLHAPTAAPNKIRTAPLTPEELHVHKFLSQYGHLSPERLANMPPDIRTALRTYKESGQFLISHYLETPHKSEWMNTYRSDPRSIDPKWAGRDAHNDLEPLRRIGVEFVEELQAAGAREGLVLRPAIKQVLERTTVTQRRKEGGLLGLLGIARDQDLDVDKIDIRRYTTDEIILGSVNRESAYELIYVAKGKEYKTNTVMNSIHKRAFSPESMQDFRGNTEGDATSTYSVSDNEALRRDLISVMKPEIATGKGRQENAMFVKVILPESEARRLHDHFRQHPEDVRPFFLEGGEHLMLLHQPPPYAEWDRTQRPLLFRTFEDANRYKDETVISQNP